MKTNLNNIYLEDLQTAEQLEEVAKLLKKKAEEIVKETREEAQKKKRLEREQAKRNNEQQTLQIKIDTVTKHLAKTTEDLNSLYADQADYLKIKYSGPQLKEKQSSSVILITLSAV